MSVKIIKIGSDGNQQQNAVPAASDWVPPVAATSGQRNLPLVPVFAVPVTIPTSNGNKDYTVSLNQKAKVLYTSFLYSAGQDAGDSFVLKDGAGNTISTIAGSAVATKFALCGTAVAAELVVAAGEILTISVTDGAAHPSGLFYIYCQPEA